MSKPSDLAKEIMSAIGANDEVSTVKIWLDTGFPPLNRIVSGRYYGGGMPSGRVIELSGPESSGKTAIANEIMKSAQRMEGIAAFFDHERSFDTDLAERGGLDVTPGRFVFKRGKTYEQTVVETIKLLRVVREKKLIPKEAPIAIVWDSLASMVPQQIADKSADALNMNDNTALARATSASFKLIAQACDDYNAILVVLNQTRTKIGVMFGDPTCVHGRTKVPFVDGTYATMKEVVENRIDKEVWSLNEATGQIEPKRIVGWHDNGPIEDTGDWVHIQAKGLHTRNGQVAITVTPEHKVLTQEGWVSASEVSIGDKMMTRRITKLNGTYEQFLRAAMSGDAHVLRNGNRSGLCLRIQDNNDPEYMRWKMEKLSVGLEFSKGIQRLRGKENEFWTSGADVDVARVDEELRGKRCPLQMLDTLTPMALAVWIMDDAYLDLSRNRYSLSVKRFARSEDLTRLSDRLFDLGFDLGVRRGEGRFDFTQESSDKIAEMIAPFVPPCMEHKLPESYRGRYEDFTLSFEERIEPEWVEVTDVRGLGDKAQMWNRTRYDITVEGNHNYMVGSRSNGVIIHNCTPGGDAVKFYCSVRIRLGKTMIKKSASDSTKIGQQIGAECIKNKVSAPFRKCKWNFMFNDDGTGSFDIEGSLVEYLCEHEIVEPGGKTSAYCYWEGEKITKKKLANLIRTDATVAEKVKALLTKADPDDLKDPVEATEEA